MKTQRKILPIVVLVLSVSFVGNYVREATAGQRLDSTTVPKYQTPLIIPPAMPSRKIVQRAAKNCQKHHAKNCQKHGVIEYYEIAVRQFQQQILPPGYPLTTVWSYGSLLHPSSFNYPAFTIEAKWTKPVRVKWVNDLKDPATGNFLPHIVPVDQTLHWANPPGGLLGRDMRGTDPSPYKGPVPIVTHVHGAHTNEESDGFPEAWYLPAAANIPANFALVGSVYGDFKAKFETKWGQVWQPGTAVFQYPNDQRATTLWYHDHTLGMTRANVYAGPAGFYIIRGGPADKVLNSVTGLPAVLPRPAPALGNPPGVRYYEIPVVIQDRSFNTDGSLFYPNDRAFFEGLNPFPGLPPYLDIPFIPQTACDGTPSDVSPIWNPEFFGNTIVVNGRTWPYLVVEQRRYRFRLLNGCNSRFLILKMDNGLPFWQIGAEGGFLPAPVMLNELLIGPAERADVIVDFTTVPAGTNIVLLNLGPDIPFGGGVPGVDFVPADPTTTGQVVQFRVVPIVGVDSSTPVAQLMLPPITPLGLPTSTRRLTLNEMMSMSVRVIIDANGSVVLDCNSPDAMMFGPIAAMLGTLNPDGNANPLMWSNAITEKPVVGTTETWEIYNFTVDAHPIHVHLVQFQVVDRQSLLTDAFGVAVQPVQLIAGTNRPPEVWESGFKDTVIAYPGEVTRIKARFDLVGLYVWHCHIIEHEDNEMMRPYYVMPMP